MSHASPPVTVSDVYYALGIPRPVDAPERFPGEARRGEQPGDGVGGSMEIVARAHA
jgi:hypothetical protein